jgi:hypothetical protein
MTRKKPTVRIPRFITDEDVGLGDVIKRATHTFGIKTCAACERRAAALNRWLRFGGGNHSTNRS